MLLIKHRTSLLLSDMFCCFLEENSYVALIRRRKGDCSDFLHTFSQPVTTLAPAHSWAASNKLGISSAESSWLQFSDFSSLAEKSCLVRMEFKTLIANGGSLRYRKPYNNGRVFAAPVFRRDSTQTTSLNFGRLDPQKKYIIDCSNSKHQKITTSILAMSCELGLHLTRGYSLQRTVQEVLMYFTHSQQRGG